MSTYLSLKHTLSFSPLPQLLNAYIGTTVRSMEAVMEGEWSENSHYTVVAVGQLVIASIVTLYVSQRMKREVLAVSLRQYIGAVCNDRCCFFLPDTVHVK